MSERTRRERVLSVSQYLSSRQDRGQVSGAYLSCFLVARKPPSALKRGGAHLKGALTAPTNNPCISVVLHSDDSEALIVLVRAQSNQEPVETRAKSSQPVSDPSRRDPHEPGCNEALIDEPSQLVNQPQPLRVTTMKLLQVCFEQGDNYPSGTQALHILQNKPHAIWAEFHIVVDVVIYFRRALRARI